MTDAQIAPEWCYNKRLHIITHEPRTCNVCTSWALHYLEEILDGAPSLRDAEHERDTDITDSLWGERESLLADNTALHEQLNTLNSILEECNKQKDQAYLALEDKTAQVITLTEQLATSQEDRPCKVPRCDPSPCPSVHSGSMDEDCEYTRLVSAPLHLLSWMLPLGPPKPEQPRAPTPTPSSTPLGFPALIPVIHCRADNSLHTPDGSVPTEDGQPNFRAHARYVFTTGYMSPDGVPNFQTTLVRSGRFLSPEAIAACKIGGRLPLVGLVLGGRNGVLISLTRDPRTQAEVDTLLNAPDKTGFA
jgi:hypothetical protein